MAKQGISENVVSSKAEEIQRTRLRPNTSGLRASNNSGSLALQDECVREKLSSPGRSSRREALTEISVLDRISDYIVDIADYTRHIFGR